MLTATLILVVVGYFVFQKQRELQQANEQAKQELQKTRGELAQTREALAQSLAARGELGSRLSASQGRIVALEKEKDAALKSRQSLEEEMRAALESKDVTISQLQGKLTVNILDRILFDSGEAELKSDGKDVLRKVAAILAQHPALQIHVIGHTDNVPIRPSAQKRFPSNWELSTARATAAVRFLTEQAGVDPRRLGAVGYGEFRPVAENTTEEGRARNRRIAITILSEELAGSDVAPTAATNAPPLGAAPSATNAAMPLAVPAPQAMSSGATNQPDMAPPETKGGEEKR